MKNSILKISFLLLFLSVSASTGFTQHCPFDGTRMIVIHLTDAENKPVVDAFDSLILREIDNADAEACTYSEGLIEKPFARALNAFSELYGINGSAEIMQKNCGDCSFLTDGFYAAKLNQAEFNCMVKKDNDFNYKKRKFEAVYEKNGVKKSVKVSENDIYSLCTGTGKWSRIVPVELKIN
ncbi:MAG: hypothetical protein LUM44_17545 [Pyrinomonadaceae bacterium]|nr:hypothetical protein [Pyrinomonadaceae bacterium]